MQLPCGVEIRPDAYTPNGHFLSVIWQGLSVQNTGQSPLSHAVFAMIEVPVSFHADSVFTGYKSDVRGFLSKPAGTRVLILLDMAGTLRTVEFPFGKDLEQSLFLDLFSLQRIDVENAEHPRAPAFTATVGILVQRLNEKEEVSVTLDTLDVEAIFSALPPGQRPEA
jgi:hypothetical protein